MPSLRWSPNNKYRPAGASGSALLVPLREGGNDRQRHAKKKQPAADQMHQIQLKPRAVRTTTDLHPARNDEKEARDHDPGTRSVEDLHLYLSLCGCENRVASPRIDYCLIQIQEEVRREGVQSKPESARLQILVPLCLHRKPASPRRQANQSCGLSGRRALHR